VDVITSECVERDRKRYYSSFPDLVFERKSEVGEYTDTHSKNWTLSGLTGPPTGPGDSPIFRDVVPRPPRTTLSSERLFHLCHSSTRILNSTRFFHFSWKTLHLVCWYNFFTTERVSLSSVALQCEKRGLFIING
jgi:hypothetical protein